MICEQHPERWPVAGIDNSKLELISECNECLAVLEYRLALKVTSGAIPMISHDFADRIMQKLDTNYCPDLKIDHRVVNNSNGARNKRLAFVHYLVASAATIIMVTTGCFNSILGSSHLYGDSLNEFFTSVSNKAAIKIQAGDNISQDIKANLKHLYGFTEFGGKQRDEQGKP
jgi:hypothetical protein